MRIAVGVAMAALSILTACTKKDPPSASASASASVSAAASATASAVASAAPATSGSGRHKREDRHEAAEDSGVPLSLEVKIGADTKTWKRDALDKVKKVESGNVANDGENRDTWSLRELAHTLVGPKARVVAVSGTEEKRTIDRAAWDDPTRTPILHTTRRGTLKFRWTDKVGKWGDAEVRDVTRLEIEP